MVTNVGARRPQPVNELHTENARVILVMDYKRGSLMLRAIGVPVPTFSTSEAVLMVLCQAAARKWYEHEEIIECKFREGAASASCLSWWSYFLSVTFRVTVVTHGF